jgi:hypothetical protein
MFTDKILEEGKSLTKKVFLYNILLGLGTYAY